MINYIKNCVLFGSKDPYMIRSGIWFWISFAMLIILIYRLANGYRD